MPHQVSRAVSVVLMTAPGHLGVTSTSLGAVITSREFFVGRQEVDEQGKKESHRRVRDGPNNLLSHPRLRPKT